MFSFSTLFRPKTEDMLAAHRRRAEQDQTQAPVQAPVLTRKRELPSAFSAFCKGLVSQVLHIKTRLVPPPDLALQDRSEIQRSSMKLALWKGAHLELEHGGVRDAQVRRMLEQLLAYAAFDANASSLSGNLAGERRALEQVRSTLDALSARQEQLSQGDRKLVRVYRRTLDTLCLGELNVDAVEAALSGQTHRQENIDYLEDTSADGTRTMIHRAADGSTLLRIRDCTHTQFSDLLPTSSAAGQPLFLHEPCIGDIRQGALGDCYLLAALTSLVSRDPGAIRSMMHDEGDTVTVRFMMPQVEEGTMRDKVRTAPREPLYVRVSKEVPLCSPYAQSCLWVQMMERAYAASMLHQRFGRAVVRELTGEEQPSYRAIAGGDSGITAALLGHGGRVTVHTHVDEGAADKNAHLKHGISAALDSVQKKYLSDQKANLESLQTELVHWNNALHAMTERRDAALLPVLEGLKSLNIHFDPNINAQKLMKALEPGQPIAMALKQNTETGTFQALETFRPIYDEFSQCNKACREVREKYSLLNQELKIKTQCALLHLPATHLNQTEEQSNAYQDDLKHMIQILADVADTYTRSRRSTFLTWEGALPSVTQAATHLTTVEELTGYMLQGGLKQVEQNWINLHCSTGDKAADHRQRQVLRLLMSQMSAKALRKFFRRFAENGFLQHAPFSGSYSPRAQTFYADVEKALAAGKLVTASTSKLSPSRSITLNRRGTGNAEESGMVQLHAYSVLGVTRDRDGLCFLRLRNPWGWLERTYTLEDGQLTHDRHSSQTNFGGSGVFLMELNDYLLTMSKTSFTDGTSPDHTAPRT